MYSLPFNTPLHVFCPSDVEILLITLTSKPAEGVLDSVVQSFRSPFCVAHAAGLSASALAETTHVRTTCTFDDRWTARETQLHRVMSTGSARLGWR
jgi:hypothetical protein